MGRRLDGLDEQDNEDTPPASTPRKLIVIEIDADPHYADWIRILE
jgi:hypothetical protein